MGNDFDKIKLIYQFNNNSPLFVKIAQSQIESYNYEEAKRILEQGLKIYPNYITALFLYGVCLSELKQFDEAKEIILKASKLLDCEESSVYYLGKISEVEGAEKGTLTLENLDNTETKLTDGNNANELSDENINSSETEDEFETLVKKLENAKLDLNIKNEETVELNSDKTFEDEIEPSKSLVSETLAKIYLNQGNFTEALNLYKNLIEIQPERSQFYLSQINYIQKIIEANQKQP